MRKSSFALALALATTIALPSSPAHAASSVSASATVVRSDGFTCSFTVSGSAGTSGLLDFSRPVSYGTTISCNGPLPGAYWAFLRPNTETSARTTWSLNGATSYGPTVSCDNGTSGSYPSTCNSGQTTWNAPDNPLGTYTYDISSTVAIRGWPWSSYPTGSTTRRYACLPTYHNASVGGVIVCGADFLRATY
jgi:hypothetical protein